MLWLKNDFLKYILDNIPRFTTRTPFGIYGTDFAKCGPAIEHEICLARQAGWDYHMSRSINVIPGMSCLHENIISAAVEFIILEREKLLMKVIAAGDF